MWIHLSLLLLSCVGQLMAQTCTQTWQNFPKLHPLGAYVYPGISTISDCQNVCTNVVINCVAIDMETTASGALACWLHISGYTNIFDLYRVSKVDDYRLTRCSNQPCTSGQWRSFPRQNSPGGNYQPGSTSLAACMNACTNDGTCLAIDWNTQDNTCYFHTASTNFDVNRGSWTIVLQFVKVQCAVPQTMCSTGPCLNGGACTDLSPTTYQCTCINGFTGSTCATPPNGCTVTWQPTVPNTTSPGGTPSNSFTLAACQAACVAQADCLGVDFDSALSTLNPPCYIITLSFYAVVRASANNVNQYIINTRC